MVIAALIIASLAVIVALGLFQGAQKAQREQTRQAIEREVQGFLTDVVVPDDTEARGTFQGASVRLSLGHYTISYEAQLPHVGVSWAELVERFAPPALRHKLEDLGLALTATDSVSGAVPREPGLGETLVTIGVRLESLRGVMALSSHAPKVLLERLKAAHGSKEVDELLLALSYIFPKAPETEEAIKWAAHREHTDAARIRERAAQWLSANRQPAYPIR